MVGLELSSTLLVAAVCLQLHDLLPDPKRAASPAIIALADGPTAVQLVAPLEQRRRARAQLGERTLLLLELGLVRRRALLRRGERRLRLVERLRLLRERALRLVRLVRQPRRVRRLEPRVLLLERGAARRVGARGSVGLDLGSSSNRRPLHRPFQERARA